jgi:hypothetical protein
MTDYGVRLSRRLFVAGSLASPLLTAFPAAIAQDRPIDPTTLKPGEFQWHPDRSPQGPVVILVSLPKQWAVVYRGGCVSPRQRARQAVPDTQPLPAFSSFCRKTSITIHHSTTMRRCHIRSD